MDAEKLHKMISSLEQGIDACRQKKLQIPPLILLYSAIEIAGSLDNENPAAGSREIFVSWVNKYLLPVRMLHCNAADLYGARCGLVHTALPSSDLSKQGKARQVGYAWDDASADAMQNLVQQIGRTNELVFVPFDELYDGWRKGVARFLQE